MKEKLEVMLKELNNGLVEREEIIKTSLLTVLAGENLLIVGPPGTGKSLISRRIAETLASSSDSNYHDYFEYLLTKFSTPEEIFGPLSITELKADRFIRNTQGYLPNVKLAFLDEIFKANSSILNALLTILNERLYHNGLEIQKVPLQALIAASNELPNNQEELSALYDRFLVRCFVDYVKEHNFKKLFSRQKSFSLSKLISQDEISKINDQAKKITIPQQIIDIVATIWQQHKETFKEDNREQLSDRRLKKVVDLLCVSAVTNERDELNLSDILLLKDCLWNHQENAVKVKEIILNVLRNNSYSVPNDETSEADNEAPVTSGAELNKVIKGLKGSGTALDPFLIENPHNLFYLARPEVGLKGYHFKQCCDIDCGELDTWVDIQFKGIYNGNGKTIKYKGLWSGSINISEAIMAFFPSSSAIEVNQPSLFSCIEQGSIITNLHLKKLHLVNLVEGSEISNCSSDFILIGDSARQSSIKQSKASPSLIKNTAENCQILDCIVVGDISLNTREDINDFAFLAKNITSNSEVTRCYFEGNIENTQNGDFYISGIAHECINSKVNNCAIGLIQTSGSHVKLNSRVVFDCDELSVIENNSSIDANIPNSEDLILNVNTVPKSLFIQYHFEYSLGWDFDSIWEWDEENNQPKLRMEPVISTTQSVKSVDLLTQQISANIWL